jgi:hypothetical protein
MLRPFKSVLLLCAAAALPVAAWSASTPIQVVDTNGGFFAACGPAGCGGKFRGLIGGVADADGNLVGATSLYLFCVDFQNNVYLPGGPYQANLTSIVNGSDLSNTRYGRASSQWNNGDDPNLPVIFRNTTFQIDATHSYTPATALGRYQMAAWLVNEYSVLPDDRDAIQEAIWHVTDVVPSANAPYDLPPYSGGAQGMEVQSLLGQAANYVANDPSGSFFSQFTIVTNVAPVYLEGQNPAQEFLAMIPGSPTPEPSTLIAFVAAIFAVMGWVRWRRTAKHAKIG